MKNLLKKIVRKLFSGTVFLLIVFLAYDATHGGAVMTRLWRAVTGAAEPASETVAAAPAAAAPELPAWIVEIGGQAGAKAWKGADVPAEKFLSAGFWRTATPDAVAAELAKGADASARNPAGRTILMFAASVASDPRAVEMLMANGADIHARDENGRTALMLAAGANDNPKVAEALLNFGAKVDERDKAGWTPLMYAAAYNLNADVAQTLINRGADVNARIKKESPFANMSAGHSLVSITKVSLQSSLDLFERLYGVAAGEKTPDKASIMAAVETTLDEMEAKIIGGENMMTPLMLAGRSSSSPAVLEMLLANGALPKAYDEKGKTVVDYAKDNPQIFNTDVYWKMNDMLYH